MKAVTPTPEETYAALAPDLRRKVDANRAARLAQQATSHDELTNPNPEKPAWATDARR
ncbi:hypothetical protein JB92DRAFT_2799609 [Gautieria morchelliformis]|nr:hypothetical protein JB92DRAFT_2799609 [Gautieria morchelliformis]